MGKTIAQMTAEVVENNKKLGWYDDGRTFGDDMALLHSEVSEALDAFRDHGLADATSHPPLDGTGRPAKPEGVGSEFADVLIRLLDTAERRGVDLDFEYERKMAYNRTRSYRHGGRAL